MADGRLGVIESVGGRGHRSVLGHRDKHAEPRYVQHGLTIDGGNHSSQTYISG